MRPEVKEGNVRHLERRQSPGGGNRLGRHVGDGRRRRVDARIIWLSRWYGGVVGYRRIDRNDAGRSEIIGGYDEWGRRDSQEVGGAGDGGLHRYADADAEGDAVVVARLCRHRCCGCGFALSECATDVNAKANTRRGGCLACHAPECVITMLRLQNGLISRILLYYFRTKHTKPNYFYQFDLAG